MKTIKHYADILLLLVSLILVTSGSVHLILLCLGTRTPFMVYVVFAGVVLYAFALTVFVIEPLMTWWDRYRNHKKNNADNTAAEERELISMSISAEFAADLQVEAEVKKQMEVEVCKLTEQVYKQIGELVSQYGDADIKTKTSVKC